MVTANQRFPIFFEEKRPFFFEASIFFKRRCRPSIRALDSRSRLRAQADRASRAQQLRAAAGLGQRAWQFQRGRAQRPETRPDIERFLDKNAYVGVLRLKRDVGKEGNLGLIATSYNFIEKHNQLGGFDGRFRLDQKTTFSFQVLGTHSRKIFFDPDRGEDLFRTGNGLGYNWNLDMSDATSVTSSA